MAGHSDSTGCANVILNLHGLRLARHGELAFHLMIDGRHPASLPLFVRKPPGAEARAKPAT